MKAPKDAPTLIGCSDCGLLQQLPPGPHGVLECRRCSQILSRPVWGGLDMPLALSASALLLLVPATLTPLMQVISFGIVRQDWLPTGPAALWRDGFSSLSLVVGLFSVLLPFLYLGLMVLTLGAVRLGIVAGMGRCFRWATRLRPWAMIEVYLVGCCVAYSRLQAVGTLHIGRGGWCLLLAAFCLLALAALLDDRSVWDALPPAHANRPGPSPRLCHDCELVIAAEHAHPDCPRCGARLHRRKPDSLRRTWALVVSGYLLYIPANTLPVLSIERFGKLEPSTILGGVRELIDARLWPLAVVVFAASILVPLAKLFGLTVMLLLTQVGSARWLHPRTRLYRGIDLIGRWSSIDLFMISILVALVQFGTLTTVRPESGAIAFAAVVVITMIASQCFDPRLMWDAAAERA